MFPHEKTDTAHDFKENIQKYHDDPNLPTVIEVEGYEPALHGELRNRYQLSEKIQCMKFIMDKCWGKH